MDETRCPWCGRLGEQHAKDGEMVVYRHPQSVACDYRWRGNTFAAAPERVSEPTQSQQASLKRRAQQYARQVLAAHGLASEVEQHDPDGGLPIIFEVTDSEQRVFGAKTLPYRDPDGVVDLCKIDMTWQYYAGMGWAEYEGVIRHELAHVIEYLRHDESGHGSRFKTIADELDAIKKIESAEEIIDHRYRVYCSGCGYEGYRKKASRVVKRPGRRQCPECGGEAIRAEHIDSGVEWTTEQEYQTARQRVEEALQVDW